MAGIPEHIWAMAVIDGLMVACPFVARLYDEPVRGWMKRRLG